MPPRRSRRTRAEEAPEDEQNVVAAAAHNSLEDPTVVKPPLARLPPELFDEIVSYWDTIPLQYNNDTYSPGTRPDNAYSTRTCTLRALSQTCKALRSVCLPRLYSRFETCWVPDGGPNNDAPKYPWFKYVMQELKRKADGFLASDPSWRAYVRTLCFMTSKSEVGPAMAALTRLMPALSNLQTIHILHCNKAGDVAKAVQGLQLPSVRTLVIPTECNCLLKCCPNVTHVRCAGGNGAAIISGLKFCKVEVLDGPIDWSTKDIVNRLVKSAPHLHTLEIRRPVSWGLGILSQNTAPALWATVIPGLVKLSELRILQVSFPGADEHDTDLASIAAARKVMQDSQLNRERKLIIKRVLAPHYTMKHKEDLIHSCVVEVFGSD